jgi:hypothetical protein
MAGFRVGAAGIIGAIAARHVAARRVAARRVAARRVAARRVTAAIHSVADAAINAIAVRNIDIVAGQPHHRHGELAGEDRAANHSAHNESDPHREDSKGWRQR